MGVAAVVLAALTGLTGREAVGGVVVTARRADDTVQVRVGWGTTRIEVRSPFGISQAVVERTGDRWPQTIVLRLHLAGLSRLKLTTGAVTLEASAGVEDGKPQVRVWKDGNEDAPLGPDSPFWVGVRILASDDSPATQSPLRDGSFEVRLPAAFLAGNPRTVTVEWIDFYRN